MPNFYVEASTGNDANPGTSDRPLQSITRAIELASEDAGATGTIHLSEGVYQSPNERFPLEIPPGYALNGVSSDTTRIRFASETRMLSGVVSMILGVIAVTVGSALRRVTVEADPTMYGGGCYTTWGINVINEGTVIENVVVQPTEPFDINEEQGLGYYRTGFGLGIYVSASASLRDVHLNVNTDMVVNGSDGTNIKNCTFGSSGITFGNGAHSIDNCKFTFIPRSTPLQSALINFGWSNLYDNVTTTFGPNNEIERGVLRSVIDCHQGSSPNIISNRISTYSYRLGPLPSVRVRSGSNPTFHGNIIGPGPKIQVDSGSSPLFEHNIFKTDLEVNSQADLGGGATDSAGFNHFGPIPYYTGVTVKPIKIGLEGGRTVYAINNYWPSDDPEDSIEISGDAEVRTDGGKRDFVRR